MFPLVLLPIKEATNKQLAIAYDLAAQFPLVLLPIKEATESWGTIVGCTYYVSINSTSCKRSNIDREMGTEVIISRFPLILLPIKEATLTMAIRF